MRKYADRMSQGAVWAVLAAGAVLCVAGSALMFPRGQSAVEVAGWVMFTAGAVALVFAAQTLRRRK